MCDNKETGGVALNDNRTLYDSRIFSPLFGDGEERLTGPAFFKTSKLYSTHFALFFHNVSVCCVFGMCVWLCASLVKSRF